MKTTIVVMLGCLAAAGTVEAQPAPSPEVQMAAALLPAPEGRRDGATVLGYDAQGQLVTLRKGTNDLVCLADDPAVEQFSAACYQKDLEPFMARGRELSAQGITGDERTRIRFEEIEAGTLAMPREPRTLYVLTGSAYDAESGEVADAYLRWVLYVPFATAETTGLPTKPVTPGGPWLMDAGTAGAHIMINPPK